MVYHIKQTCWLNKQTGYCSHKRYIFHSLPVCFTDLSTQICKKHVNCRVVLIKCAPLDSNIKLPTLLFSSFPSCKAIQAYLFKVDIQINFVKSMRLGIKCGLYSIWFFFGHSVGKPYLSVLWTLILHEHFNFFIYLS